MAPTARRRCSFSRSPEDGFYPGDGFEGALDDLFREPAGLAGQFGFEQLLGMGREGDLDVLQDKSFSV